MDGEKEILKQLEVLGEQLANDHNDVERKVMAYKSIISVHDKEIEVLENEIRRLRFKAEDAAREKKAALDTAVAKHEATRAEILNVWIQNEELPKTITSDRWQIQKRVNKNLVILDETLVLERLKEIGKYDAVVKQVINKTSLKALVVADLFVPAAVIMKDNPTLIFTLKEGLQ